MKLNRLSLIVLAVVAEAATVYAQDDFRRWTPQNGVAVRQGSHIEWYKSSAYRDNGERRGEIAIAWTDCRRGDRDVYLQVFDEAGEPRFGEGVLVAGAEKAQTDPCIVACSDGGWFIGWIDFEQDEFGDVHCAKIDSTGRNVWGDSLRSVVISNAEAGQRYIQIVEGADASCFVIWSEERNSDILAQHILANGARDNRWPETGVGIVTDDGNQGRHKAIWDIDGGAIIGWEHIDRAGARTVRAERINRAGELLWGNGSGISLTSHASSQTNLTLCPDGAGGAFICWCDDVNANRTDRDLWAQRVNAQGSLLWGETGAAVCDTIEAQENPIIIQSGAVSAIIVWEDKRVDGMTCDLYAMKITGEERMAKQWDPPGGVQIIMAERNQRECSIADDLDGGAYFVWEDDRGGGFPEVSIYGQHIESGGSVTWRNDGILIQGGNYIQSSPQVYLGGENLMVIWGSMVEPEYPGSFTLVNQLVSLAGELPEREVSVIAAGLSGGAFDMKLLPGLNGWFTMVWTDGRAGGVGSCPYIQHGRNAGDHVEYRFASQGVPVMTGTIGGGTNPDAVDDGGGGTIVVWEDHRIGQPYSIYGQSISIGGERLWWENGVPISDQPYEAVRPKACRDDNGGAFVGWKNPINDGNNNIFLQHIDEIGRRLWGTDLAVSTSEYEDNLEAILPDGQGGVVMLWTRDRWMEDHTDVWAARISRDGRHLWGNADGGIPICNAGLEERSPRMMWSPQGFAFTWEHLQDQDSPSQVRAQFVTLDGQKTLEDNGSPLVVSALDSYNPEPLFDREGNLWVVWQGTPINSSESDVHLQRLQTHLDDSGRVLRDFGAEGKLICDGVGSQIRPTITPDGQDGVYLLWEDYRTRLYSDVYGMHLDSNGERIEGWAETGNVICNADRRQSGIQAALLTSAGDDGIVVAWEDSRASQMEELYNLYIQRVDDDWSGVSEDHTPAYPISLWLNPPYPNPFNSSTSISYTLPLSGYYRMDIVDINGRLVERLFDGWKAAGVYRELWNAGSNPNGLYMMRIESGKLQALRTLYLIK